MSDAPDLNELVVRCLDALEESGPAAVEVLCAEHPEHAERLRTRLAALRAAGLVRSDSSSQTFPERLGEFRLIERLGSGGMGVVYLAEQTTLGRRVALKLIRPDQLYFEGARERFRREVEAVARLAHPGIVGVHSVGEEHGIPYFAMDLVAGASLDTLLSALRGRSGDELDGRQLFAAVERLAGTGEPGRPDDPLFTGDWTKACLWIAREVAQALEHAHQRGVLHRDLKPSNIMLTPAGRVLLLDFGLASSGGPTRLTRTGSQVGSLPYMAPEQVQGEATAIDVRTDVYGLAATLYELLSLRAPFDQGTQLELQRAIVAGSAPRLRQLRPSLSRDVEAVVGVAMDPERQRRYASAAEFAGDLSCVLEGRPVAARPAGTWVQLVRWGRRQPGAAAAVFLGVLIAVGWPLLLALQSRREARSERIFAADLALQRDFAEQGFERSRQAVRTMLERVASETLVDIPRMDAVRRELLADALRLYDELVAQRPLDAELSRERALVVRALNEASRAIGAYDEALVGYDLEIARLRARLETGTADTADRIVLANMLNSRGVILDEAGQTAPAIVLFEQGLELQRALARENALDPELAHDHAILAMNLGLNRQREGDPRATGLLGEALALSRELVAAQPDDLRFRKLLAQSLNVSALELRGRSELTSAQTHLREAGEQLEDLVARDPHDRNLRLSLSQVLGNLTLLLYDTGHYEEGLRFGARSSEVATALVADFPTSGEYRDTLAGALINEGIQHQALGHLEAALDRYVRSIEVCRARLEALPDLVQTRHFLSAALAHAGSALMDLDRLDEAEDSLLEGLDVARDVLAQRPDGRTARYYAGMTLAHLGALRARTARASQAVESLEQASGLLEWPAEDLVFLGQAWMEAFAAVEADAQQQSSALLERCCQGALAALEAAQALEPSALAGLAADDRLEPLRGRPRFEALSD